MFKLISTPSHPVSVLMILLHIFLFVSCHMGLKCRFQGLKCGFRGMKYYEVLSRFSALIPEKSTLVPDNISRKNNYTRRRYYGLDENVS